MTTTATPTYYDGAYCHQTCRWAYYCYYYYYCQHTCR